MYTGEVEKRRQVIQTPHFSSSLGSEKANPNNLKTPVYFVGVLILATKWLCTAKLLIPV
jgi:hypothetical protein